MSIVIMDMIYFLNLKKTGGSFYANGGGFTSAVQNHQDERCTETALFKNKHIWQNIVGRFGLVD